MSQGVQDAWNWSIIWPNIITIVVTIGAFILAYVTSVKSTARMTEIVRDTKLADLRTRWIEDTRKALADFDELAINLVNPPDMAVQNENVARLLRLKTYIRLKLHLPETLHEKAMKRIEQIFLLSSQGKPFANESEEVGRLFNKIFKIEWNRVLVHLGEKTAEDAEREKTELLKGE
ncbi:MAG: hypothetical protein NTAFB05_24400 [Nitrobacter sp.]|uniref:hypothetical protein n=1 Tax=Nitrobacter sp. TaxID=29420 RepID=UPI00387DD9E7